MSQTKNIFIMKFTKYHLPLVLYAALIIIISSISHLKQPQLKFFSVDKLAHFIEYSLLALLTYRSFSHFSSKVSVFQALIRSVGFVTLFALLDEFYQRYIPGRFFDYYDIIFDLLGAYLVIGYLAYKHKTINSTTS